MSSIVRSDDFGPHGFRWLTLKRITYKDPHGRTRFWESAERLSRHGEVDGVAIITLVRAAEQPLRVILESQFRASQGNFVIELPAGLIDEGETAEHAAVRELKEETGYAGRVLAVSPVCYSDPGMTNANMQFAVLDVDADAPENASVSPELEEGEFIDVFLLPFDGLYAALLAKQKETGHDIDARLLLYADAIERTQQRVFSSDRSDAAAAAAAEKEAPSVPEGADGSLPHLHIKTGRPERAQEPSSAGNGHLPSEHKVHDPDEGHYNTEGFIAADPSPAVLKTEFPAEFEHVTEHPPGVAFEGEILLENEAPPGHERLYLNGMAAESSRESKEEAEPRQPSVDLAAGLRRCQGPSGSKGVPEEADDIDLAAGLSRFRPTSAGSADGAPKEIFATPMKRQGSLIAMTPLPGPNAAPAHGSAAGDGVVYCPVGISPQAEDRSAGDKSSAPAALPARQHQGGGQSAEHEAPAKPEHASDGFFGFGAGLVMGGVAGALLMYMGCAHRP